MTTPTPTMQHAGPVLRPGQPERPGQHREQWHAELSWRLAGSRPGNHWYVSAESLVLFLIGLAICGLIIGAIGRLLVPGPTPLGVLGTMGAGVAGALIGGFVGRLLMGPSLTQGWVWVLSVLGAAAVVALVSGRGRGYGRGRRGRLMSDPSYDDRVIVEEVPDPYPPVRRRRRFF